MTSSAHGHYNYNRRHSTTTPYTIPIKHQQSHHQQYMHSQSFSSHTYAPKDHDDTIVPMSTSVPTLSREFVVRRISEGETGRLKEELKCEACGKGYKHISSLAKHLWEHTPEWNVTKKLLISKHQQVQLLEAASILVGMNEVNKSRRNSVFDDAPSERKYSRANSVSLPPPSLSASAKTPKEEPGAPMGGFLDERRASVTETPRESPAILMPKKTSGDYVDEGIIGPME